MMEKEVTRQGQDTRPHPHRSHKNTIIDAVVLLSVCHLLPEAGTILSKFVPSIKKGRVNLFFCPSFKYEQEIYWYIKDSGESLAWVIAFYVLTKICARYSTSLFLVSFIWFLYHIVDVLMYWWNFSTYVYFYWFVIWTAIVTIKGIVWPYKPERFARIKSLF